MHPHAELIQRFYRAFDALDGKAMQSCYAPQARFRDPVFDLLGAQEIGAMWQMLCEAATARGSQHWQLEVSAIEADDARGRAHWEPHYLFGPDARPVHNIIDADFEFRDGLIVSHVDTFDVWRWSRQALGLSGTLLGWTPWLQAKVRVQANRGLSKWKAGRTGGHTRP